MKAVRGPSEWREARSGGYLLIDLGQSLPTQIPPVASQDMPPEVLQPRSCRIDQPPVGSRVHWSGRLAEGCSLHSSDALGAVYTMPILPQLFWRYDGVACDLLVDFVRVPDEALGQYQG